MASIPAYLAELEARLAPSLDAGALQERLTEAENHLRDRAQEFEEIGLPAKEAEARAVAAFGEPEEYAEGVPTRTLPPAPRETRKPSRDLALQLAWSAAGLGLVAMVLQNHAAESAGAAIVAIFGFGALFGRPTALHRMALLAAASAVLAFPVMMGFYEPVPSNGYHTERIAVRPRGALSEVDWSYAQARWSQERFLAAYEEYLHTGTARRTHRYGKEGYTAPAAEIQQEYWGWQDQNVYPYAVGAEMMETYATREEAAKMWKRNGSALAIRLQEVVAKAKPVDPGLSDAALIARFVLLALMGGVAFLASMVGVQALALMLRGVFVGIGRRLSREGPPARSHAYEPERL